MSRGYFGIGIENTKCKLNIGTLYRHAFAFGAAFVFTIGKRYQQQASDTTKTQRHIPLYHYKDIKHFKDSQPVNCRVVGVELFDGAFELFGYSHPQQAIYLLGAEGGGLSNAAIDSCQEVVEIPKLSYCLNVAGAGTVVMYDRLLKQESTPIAPAPQHKQGKA